MNTEKIDEIIKILRAIADTSTSNKIALLSVILSAIAVGSSIYFSYKTRKQYIESLNPLLSFQLVDNCGLLFLTIKNTGQSEAIEIKIIFDEISNNGEETLFDIAKIFKSELTLYPNEKVTGYIAKAGANISTEIAPTVKVHVSYIKGNNKKKTQYSRSICYAGETDNPIEDRLREIGSKLNEISASNNRMANYFSGNWLLTIDELNLQPQRNLYQDIKDGVNNKERPDEDLLGRDKNGRMETVSSFV